MMAAYPDLNYISDSDYNREDNGLHYRFFELHGRFPKANATFPKTTRSAACGSKSAAKFMSTSNPT